MDTLLHWGLSNALVAAGLAVVAALASRSCRRPALVHGLWLLVLLKLVTPPLWGVSVLPVAGLGFGIAAKALASPEPIVEAEAIKTEVAGEASEPLAALPLSEAEPLTTDKPTVVEAAPLPTPGTAAPAAELPATPAQTAGGSWQALILPCWSVGSLLWLGLLFWRTHRFRQYLAFAQAAPPWLQRQTGQLAGQLGLRSCPGVWLLPGAVSPMLWSLGGRPRLLLPTALWNRLDEDQRTTLLLHELAHLRRGDHWVRVLELLATGLFWWNPVLWWARRELREAEEQCCDAWVLWARPDFARAYATALVCTVDYLCEARASLPAVASGFGQVTLLKRRLTMIMRGTAPRTTAWGGFLAVLGLAVLLVPTWAQEGPPRRDPPPPPRGGEEQAQDDRDATRRRAEEAERLKVEMVRMTAEMERMVQHVREVQERMRQFQEEMQRAQERFSDLTRKRESPRDRVAPLAPMKDRVRPVPGGGMPGVPAPGKQPSPVAEPRGGPQPPRATMERMSEQDRRMMELENKLERVLQEVREIHRTMQDQRQMPRPGMGGGGGGPGRPGEAGRPGEPGRPGGGIGRPSEDRRPPREGRERRSEDGPGSGLPSRGTPPTPPAPPTGAAPAAQPIPPIPPTPADAPAPPSGPTPVPPPVPARP